MAATTPVLEGHTLKDPKSPDGYNETVYYRGTSVELADGSIAWDIVTSNSTTVSIDDITQADPAVVTTSSSHNLSTNDIVSISSVSGMTEVNGYTFIISVVDADEFQLVGIDSTGYTAYSSGGTVTLINDDKRDFTIEWVGLTTTQKNLIETAFAALRSGYNSSNFTAPTGTTYTVTRHPSQEELDFDAYYASDGNLYWTTTLQLREV